MADPGSRHGRDAGDVSAAADATVTATRALLGVVARSMTDALNEVTLPQFRVMVILSNHGRMRAGALAELVGTAPSTLTRSLDRMVVAGWLTREANPESRREVLVELTEQGKTLVDTVTESRRAEITAIVNRMSAGQRSALTKALHAFNHAAGEPSATDLLILGV